MTIERIKLGISKRRTEEDWMHNWGHRYVAASLCEDGGELSRVSWLGPPRGLIGANFGSFCLRQCAVDWGLVTAALLAPNPS